MAETGAIFDLMPADPTLVSLDGSTDSETPWLKVAPWLVLCTPEFGADARSALSSVRADGIRANLILLPRVDSGTLASALERLAGGAESVRHVVATGAEMKRIAEVLLPAAMIAESVDAAEIEAIIRGMPRCC